MANLQYKFLKEIYRNYSARSETSLNDFAEREYKKLKSNQSKKEFAKDIKAILLDAESRDLITWKADSKSMQNGVFSYHWLDIPYWKGVLGETDSTGVERTFDNVYVEVKLTHGKGYDYAANFVNSEASLSTNIWIKVFTVWLAAVATLALLIQFLQYIQPQQQSTQSIRVIEQYSKCAEKSSDSVKGATLVERNKASVETPVFDTLKK